MSLRLNRGSAWAGSMAVAVFAAVTACGGDGAVADGGGEPPVGPPADPRIALVVDKGSDDGAEGTLRWAITRSNAEPGKYRITFKPDALTIRPVSELPSIVGPARIEGVAGSGGPSVVLDGVLLYDLKQVNAAGNPTACPGEADGQFGANVRSLKNAGLKVVDSGNVEIEGIEVRNFCTGIMILRSHDNRIRKVRLFNNLGASGVLLTGDDGAGNPTSGKAINNLVEDSDFLNNSDSIDVARGAEGSIIRNSIFRIDKDGVMPSQGIEVLSTNNVKIIGNILAGFSEALQVSGDGHEISGNTLNGNAIAATMRGNEGVFTDNVVHGNRMGLGTRGGTVTISRNRIYDNGKDISLCNAGGICSGNANWMNARLGISLNYSNGPVENDSAAMCADGFPDCDTRQNVPVLLPTSGWAGGGYFLEGSLASRPSQAFVIEFFASRRAGLMDGRGEGERFVGRLEIKTDASGNVRFSYPTGQLDPLGDGTTRVYFTATATRVSNGQTSEFSRGVWIDGP